MSTKLVNLRRSAYETQSGRCYYCGFPMWQDDPKSFALTYNITLSEAQLLKCTAEHLEARGDGGNDTPENIVAACRFCNSRRHYRKQAPSPGAHLQRVQQRLNNGHWHYMSLMRKFKAFVSCPSGGVRVTP